jgi:RNA polymerase sigma factor (TIGR02999 family)
MKSSASITQLLIKWRNGDQAALNELLPMVYSELRRLANYYLRHERPGHTMQPTDLVHEAYLRLVEGKEIDWQNRAHFFGIAAVRMRRILVEHARSRNESSSRTRLSIQSWVTIHASRSHADRALPVRRRQPASPDESVRRRDSAAAARKTNMSL